MVRGRLWAFPSLKLLGPGLPPAHSLVVLALVLCDVKLCVQLVQQRVRALLTQRVIHVRLPGHDVKEIAGDLQEAFAIRLGEAVAAAGFSPKTHHQ